MAGLYLAGREAALHLDYDLMPKMTKDAMAGRRKNLGGGLTINRERFKNPYALPETIPQAPVIPPTPPKAKGRNEFVDVFKFTPKYAQAQSDLTHQQLQPKPKVDHHDTIHVPTPPSSSVNFKTDKVQNSVEPESMKSGLDSSSSLEVIPANPSQHEPTQSEDTHSPAASNEISPKQPKIKEVIDINVGDNIDNNDDLNDEIEDDLQTPPPSMDVQDEQNEPSNTERPINEIVKITDENNDDADELIEDEEVSPHVPSTTDVYSKLIGDAADQDDQLKDDVASKAENQPASSPVIPDDTPSLFDAIRPLEDVSTHRFYHGMPSLIEVRPDQKDRGSSKSVGHEPSTKEDDDVDFAHLPSSTGHLSREALSSTLPSRFKISLTHKRGAFGSSYLRNTVGRRIKKVRRVFMVEVLNCNKCEDDAILRPYLEQTFG